MLAGMRYCSWDMLLIWEMPWWSSGRPARSSRVQRYSCTWWQWPPLMFARRILLQMLLGNPSKECARGELPGRVFFLNHRGVDPLYKLIVSFMSELSESLSWMFSI